MGMREFVLGVGAGVGLEFSRAVGISGFWECASPEHIPRCGAWVYLDH